VYRGSSRSQGNLRKSREQPQELAALMREADGLGDGQ